jgi:hypothetical protein
MLFDMSNSIFLYIHSPSPKNKSNKSAFEAKYVYLPYCIKSNRQIARSDKVKFKIISFTACSFSGGHLVQLGSKRPAIGSGVWKNK